MHTILVLEDDQDILEVICFLLDAEGFDVRGHMSVEKALEEFDNRASDLVVLDWYLCRTADAERFLPRIGQIPVLLLSTEPPRDVGFRYDALVNKPFDIDGLMSIVKDLLNIASRVL